MLVWSTLRGILAIVRCVTAGLAITATVLTTIGLTLIALGEIDLGSNYSVPELVGLWLATVAALGASYALAVWVSRAAR